MTTAVTNSAGAYVLGSLGNGAYYVRTSDDKGFVDRLFPNLPCERCDLAAGTPVVVTGAGATGIDFTLTPAAIVEGRVTDGEGAALADAAVEMIDGGGALHGRAITGPTGAYRLEVPRGPTGPAARRSTAISSAFTTT